MRHPSKTLSRHCTTYFLSNCDSTELCIIIIKRLSPTLLLGEVAVRIIPTFVTAGMEHADPKRITQLHDGRPQPYTDVMAAEWDQRLRTHADVANARNQLDWGTARQADFCYPRIYPR
jgi:hypothetical protein